MTDINKQIEEERILDDIELEALKYARQEYPNSTKPIQAIIAGDCSRFAKQILHSSRWRKVSEGFPESGEDVSVKCECGSLEVSFKGEMSGRIICNCEDCDNIVEWKPID